VGCPFAPRCAWRLDVCWREMPPLDPIGPTGQVVTTGPQPTHRVACHNQPTRQEAAAGKPLRDGFVPAPPPGSVVAELKAAEPAAEEELVAFDQEADPLTTVTGAGGLPLPPDEGASAPRSQTNGDSSR
jgi:hypothetical protein